MSSHAAAPANWAFRITGVLYGLLGLALAGAGLWLLLLGGSAYYALLGLALLATGALLFRGHPAAGWLFAAALLGTLGWSLLDAGLYLWQLLPRCGLLVVLGLWLIVLPYVGRRAELRAGLRDGSRDAAPRRDRKSVV